MASHKDLERWTREDVQTWIRGEGFGAAMTRQMVAGAAASNATGRALASPHLDETYFVKQWKLKPMMAKRVLKRVQALRQRKKKTPTPPPPGGGAFPLTVKMGRGRPIVLPSVTGSTTVRRIKELLADREGYALDDDKLQINVFYKSRARRDSETLAAMGISKHNAVVMVSFKCKGGGHTRKVTVSVRVQASAPQSASRWKVTVSVKKRDTVAALAARVKQLLARKCPGIAEASMVFSLRYGDSVVLHNEDTVYDSGVWGERKAAVLAAVPPPPAACPSGKEGEEDDGGDRKESPTDPEDTDSQVDGGPEAKAQDDPVLAVLSQWTPDQMAEWLACLPADCRVELTHMALMAEWKPASLVQLKRGQLDEMVTEQCGRGRNARTRARLLKGALWREVSALRADPEYHLTRQARELCQKRLEAAAEHHSLAHVLAEAPVVPGEGGYLARLRRHRPSVAGLTNLGNTCFFNSILQPLSQVPEFVPYLLGLYEAMKDGRDEELQRAAEAENTHWWSGISKRMRSIGRTLLPALVGQQPEPLSNPASVLEELILFLHRVHDMPDAEQGHGHHHHSARRNVAPAGLRGQLGRTSPIFRTRRQEDSFEAATHLLDCLHQDMLALTGKCDDGFLGEVVEFGEEEDDAKYAAEHRENRLRQAPTAVSAMFEGVQAVTSECYECGLYCRRYESFRFVELPLVSHIGQQSLLLVRPGQPAKLLHCCAMGFSPVESLRWEAVRHLRDEEGLELVPDDFVLAVLDSRSLPCRLGDAEAKGERVDSLGKRLVFACQRAPQRSVMSVHAVLAAAGEEGTYPEQGLVQWLPWPDTGAASPATIFDRVYEHRAQQEREHPPEKSLLHLESSIAVGGQWLDPSDADVEVGEDQVVYVCWHPAGRLVPLPAALRAPREAEEAERRAHLLVSALAQLRADDMGRALRSACRLFGAAGEADALVALVDSARERNERVREHRRTQWRSMQSIVREAVRDARRGCRAHQGSKDLRSVPAMLAELQEPHVYLKDDFSYFCCGCEQTSSMVRRQRTVLVPPQVLLLRLERFREDERRRITKIRALVEFPTGDEPLPLAGSSLRLFGVSSHSGSSACGGHYTAQVRRLGNPGQWYSASDSSVHRTSSTHAVSADAMVLFYAEGIPETERRP